jgi:endonuclease/exonuclease/phosphatase (EEP) superfamily protein YafD
LEAWLVGIGTVLVAATLLPFIRGQSWWIRIFDFPRMQIAAAMLLVLLAHVLTVDASPWGQLLRAALIAGLALQVGHMLPYTRLARSQVEDSRRADPDNSVRLLFANVLQSNRDAAALLAVVRKADPDVVLALEADRWWCEQLAELSRSHPFTVLRPQDNTYGMLLYSRLALIEPVVSHLVQDDVPSIHTGLRLPSGRLIKLHCLHPRPPAPTESDSSVPRDAELLIVGRAVREDPGPTVVMGDMNDVAWSHTSQLFRDISGLLDPRVGRGFFNTFNAKHALIRFPLDHFFHSNDFRLVEFCRMPYIGSDHFPVYIHLSHEPDAVREQAEPAADAEEGREAEEKIAQAPAAGTSRPAEPVLQSRSSAAG